MNTEREEKKKMDKEIMLNRQGLISDILDLYDYIDNLERENERLKSSIPKVKENKKGINFVDLVMIERGKKEIFKEVFRNWNEVKCSFNEDTKKYEFTSFNEWIRYKLDMDDMPRTLSYEDFVCYFKEELQERYTKEKEEALRKFKEEKEE